MLQASPSSPTHPTSALCERLLSSHPCTITVWGLGKTGRALVTFLRTRFPHHQLLLTDRSAEVCAQVCAQEGLSLAQCHTDPATCIALSDIVIPSQGVSLHPWREQIGSKLLTELDLFGVLWKGPLIAITGSIGKTTVTSLVHHLMIRHQKCVVGGNIGIPLFSLFDHPSAPTCPAVIEVSNFQLEHVTLFCPSRALITNLYPNHLDRQTWPEYITAKKNIYARHTSAHSLCVTTQAARIIGSTLSEYPGTLDLIHTDADPLPFSLPPRTTHTTSTPTSIHFAEEKNPFLLGAAALETFEHNWALAVRGVACAGYPLSALAHDTNTFSLPRYRCTPMVKTAELVVYNDSKSTVMEATTAALARVQRAHPGWPVTLIIGGLSKGVSRTEILASYRDQVAHVICFGAESVALYNACSAAGIPATHVDTLDRAVHEAWVPEAGARVILFSPGGTSLDLYKNFEERGAHFTFLIEDRLNLASPQRTRESAIVS